MTDYRIIAQLSSPYSNAGLYCSSELIVVWVVSANSKSEAIDRFNDYIMDHQLTDFYIVFIKVEEVSKKFTIQISFDKYGGQIK